MHLRAKSLIGKPGKHPHGDTSRQAVFTAAEAGASTLYCTSFPDKQNELFSERSLLSKGCSLKLY